MCMLSYVNTCHCSNHYIYTRFYVGRQPRIAISDVDLAKDIMVKEFDNFSDRGFLVSEAFGRPRRGGLH